MSKKIIIFIFCAMFQLQAAENHDHKKRINTLAELGSVIQEARKEVIKGPTTPFVSSHRKGPRFDGDPDQRKKNTEQK